MIVLQWATMRRIVDVLLVLFVIIGEVKSLKCHQCQGDPGECEKSATIQECQSFPNDRNSDQICASYYHWVNGDLRVNKHCRSRKSCRDDTNQQSNRCGEHDGINRPCRCCCEEDNCNRLMNGCIVDSVCSKPKNFPNGFVHCPSPRSPGSKCNFTCNPGFDLIGAKTATCVVDATTGKPNWSNLNQACLTPVRCYPMLRAPVRGSISCKNHGPYRSKQELNFLGSTCYFGCDRQFQLVGTRSSRCRLNRKWSAGIPTCRPRLCFKFPPASNRRDLCTDGNLLGSTCGFQCTEGYKLIGSELAVCMSDAKDRNTQEWSRDPPFCAVLKCEPPQRDPLNGRVTCTNENFEDSVCSFSCDLGFKVDGISKKSDISTCSDDGGMDSVGKWSRGEVTCTPVTCRPRFTRIQNGHVACTDENFVGSQCNFSCNVGFDLDDATFTEVISECHDSANGESVGVWSLIPPPTCSPILCRPRHKNPANGKVVCTQGNSLGSVCTFRCDQHYDMDGTGDLIRISGCEKSGNNDALGMWTAPAPTCSRMTCEDLQISKNIRFTCSAANNAASICIVDCDFGYELMGPDRIACEDRKRDGDNVAEWSSAPPSCKRIYCPAQIYDQSRLKRACNATGTARFPAGTICTYTCAKPGYYLSNQGYAEDTETVEIGCKATKTWSAEVPTCIPITCEHIDLQRPNNAHAPACTNGYFHGSRCTFKCRDSFVLSHSSPMVCESDGNDTDKKGRWSHSVPNCVSNECSDFGQRPFGRVSYTNGFKVGSFALLHCAEGYTQKFRNQSECVAADEKHEVPYWKPAKDICCVRCSPSSNIKLVMIVDKTAAKNAEEWQAITTWCTNILEFLFAKEYKINFGSVLYGMDVDPVNSTPLKLTRIYKDITKIQDNMQNIQFGGDKSRTGLAMKYTRENYFKFSKLEEPYAIVISGQNADDDAAGQLEMMRNENINILSLFFERNGSEDLTRIAGEERNAFPIGKIEDLEKVTERIMAISKERGCRRASKTQRCP